MLETVDERIGLETWRGHSLPEWTPEADLRGRVIINVGIIRETIER